MNSEELELSLRSEFESHLKETLAGMREEVVQLQDKIEAEFAKHKDQLDEIFKEFSNSFTVERKLDEGFTETVIEHLRLARDEGSKVAVAAMEKAETMQVEAEPVLPKAGVKELRDAISDISTKTTQSSILKSLVNHAAEFTPRGAFFIIKNEHLVGWRVFGKEGTAEEEAVREVFFPVATETILGASIRSLSAMEGSFGDYPDDSIYLNKLEFGHPDRMYAMPLVVRGRAVAVLYADNGENGEDVNVEALETLARVASLTVEVLAFARSSKSAAVSEEKRSDIEESGALDRKYVDFETPKTEFQETVSDNEIKEEKSEAGLAMTESEKTDEPVEKIQEVEEAEYTYSAEKPIEEFEKTETSSVEVVESFQDETVEVQEVEVVEETSNQFEATFEAPDSTTADYDFVTDSETQDQTETESETTYQFESDRSFEPVATDFEFTPSKPESAPFENSQFEYDAPQEVEESTTETVVKEEPQETVPDVSATQPAQRSRFSDRNVDLPIEVGEEERRLHNDARRFARLLVSEIKLYNEQKVKEGREAGDLYERLREAIDRSREMYDKRVQPPVAARFDYFHYEIINTLAEGDENKLGESYPGATV